MQTRSKGPRVRSAGKVQAIVARNLAAEIAQHYGPAVSTTTAREQFATASGTSLSQINRAVSGKQSLGLDVLERYAETLGVPVTALLAGLGDAGEADADLEELVRTFRGLRL